MGCNLARECVSKEKKRTITPDFNLDLAVIHDHIIAMGFPSIGVESLYRNRYRDVRKFLDTSYGDDYMVYNLCSEPNHFYTASDLVKGETLFDGRVVNFPFPDHHAGMLEDIPLFIEHAMKYINSGNKDRVVCIHCKAGKGRTGLFICALILAMENDPTLQTPESVISYYGVKRTKDGKGLTLPCQKRYVSYYNNLRMQYGGRMPSSDLIPVYYLKSIGISGGLMQYLCKADCIRIHLGAYWKSRKVINQEGSDNIEADDKSEKQEYVCIEIPVSKAKCEASGKGTVMAFDSSKRS
eukprot:Tbor_TRINITY_DN4825_c0_g4::TRINITY_DN4825_c0_g4_i1::g.1517::m.1517/K01110/PTEN; phosphatidylinositol-3,4,5-trisphosphate 3-phosphatase and dual-specificity protein phosphatase PTEN